jgi:hypothetical protein
VGPALWHTDRPGQHRPALATALAPNEMRQVARTSRHASRPQSRDAGAAVRQKEGRDAVTV